MKKTVLILLFFVTMVSCKSTKTVQTKAKKKRQPTTEHVSTSTTTNSEEVTIPTTVEYNVLANNIVEEAKNFEGTRYKYGGTTKRGMDCSGLVVTSFNSENIKLPRTTGELAKTGDWIDLKEVQKGDLLFFATRKNSRKVNHVGIVTETRVGYVEFIHASTSSGVIVSSLTEKYWYFAFVQARRVL